MSRWQPRYTDPAKARYDREARTSPFSQRRIAAAARIAAGEKPCSWRACVNVAVASAELPFCWDHLDTVNAVFWDRQKRYDQEREEREAREAEDRRRGPKNLYAPGWIYYIEIDGLIKIGYAGEVRKRMRAYPPTAKLLAVEPGTLDLEAARHGKFKHTLSHGREWFKDTPDIRAWIGQVRSEYGDPSGLAYKYTQPVVRPDEYQVVAGKRLTNRRR